jgi:5'/3'-nucleotidase
MSRHILLSNDDGIQAHGLKLLAWILQDLPDTRVTIVAPADQQSASSHSLTLRDPLRITQHAVNAYAVSGTPTDSVLVAVEHILKDDKPDFVFSGVNHGSNMGEDVTYSGTVAAAMEGTLLGIPSYAISTTAHNPQHWDGTEAFLRSYLEKLMSMPPVANCLINVNIPDLPPEELKGVRAAPLGSRRYHDVITAKTDPRGNPYVWISGGGPDWENIPDSDAVLNQAGYVVLTPLNVDYTHHAMLERLSTLNIDGLMSTGESKS